MQITNLKICLATSVLLLDLLSVSYAEDTTFAGVDGPQDFNTIQATVYDSNTIDTIVVEDGARSQSSNHDTIGNGKVLAVRPADPNDPNLATGRIIDHTGCAHNSSMASTQKNAKDKTQNGKNNEK